MKLHDQIAVWLHFSKKERTGIVIILMVCVLTWVLPVFFAEEDFPENSFEITAVEIQQAIRILDSSRSFVNRGENSVTGYIPKWHERKNSTKNSQVPMARLDINLADSVALERLPGIGIKLSSRIIRYRQRLGGFVSIAQLAEVYGVTDSLIVVLRDRLIVQQGFQPEKIPINIADYKALRKLPYLDHQVVKAILAYRQAHGVIKNENELAAVMLLERSVLEKIKPYITYNH